MSKTTITTTWGDVIKSGADISTKMKDAIEADARKRAESERLHPLKDYPYKSFYQRPIDPSA